MQPNRGHDMRGPVARVAVRRLPRLTLVAGLAVAAFMLAVIPSMAAAKSFHGRITSAATARQTASRDPNRGTLSVAARRAIQGGYLVADQAGYDRSKARLARRTASREAATAPFSYPLAPLIVSGRSFQGINNPNVA